MPLKLRNVLQKAGISQRQFGDLVLQANGTPMSDSMVSLLLGRGSWPRNTPRAWIEERTRHLLREKKSPHAEDADLFELDEERIAETAPIGSTIDPKRDRTPVQMPEIEISQEPEPLEREMLNPATKRHFKLFREPFTDDVQASEDVFMSADQRYVREAIWQSMKHPGGIIAIIAESGAGKTVLRRECIDRIQRDQIPCRVIMPRTLDKAKLTARGLCEAIKGDLAPEQKTKQAMEELSRQVESVLLTSTRSGQNHVLLIEEAHDLTPYMLKLLKRFWEIEDGFRKALSIVLFGQTELKAKLNETRYPEIREFIRRCEQVELLPLDNALADYLTLKFKRIDSSLDNVMDADAVGAIRERLTKMRLGCYPLIVNNLVTRAMNKAAELGAPRVTPDIVGIC